jgi:predicted nucleic acid-binding protein
MSTQYLMDMSAWARLGNPRLSQARSDEIADAMLAGRIHACAPFLLELGMTAVNQRDFASIMSMARAAMPYVALSDDIAQTAFAMHEHLARSSHHRVKPVDLVLAATAARHDLTVLHVDKHYDIIAKRGGVPFAHEWLGSARTLG